MPSTFFPSPVDTKSYFDPSFPPFLRSRHSAYPFLFFLRAEGDTQSIHGYRFLVLSGMKWTDVFSPPLLLTFPLPPPESSCIRMCISSWEIAINELGRLSNSFCIKSIGLVLFSLFQRSFPSSPFLRISGQDRFMILSFPTEMFVGWKACPLNPLPEIWSYGIALFR